MSKFRNLSKAKKFIIVILAVFLLGCVAKKTEIFDVNFGLEEDDDNFKATQFEATKGRGVKFFGDSHLGNDVIVDIFRKEFFGESENSIGFVPAIMPKYHANAQVKFTQNGFNIISSRTEQNADFPLCGVIIDGKKDANITLELKKLSGEFVLEILHKGNGNSRILEVKDADGKSRILTHKKPGKWEYSELNATFPVTITALDENAQIGGYKIRRNGDFVDSCATNGAYSTIISKWGKGAFNRDFRGLEYDMFVIAYGTNDALDRDFSEEKFYTSLQKLIQKLRKTSPNATFVLIAPPPAPKVPKATLATNAIKKLANNENAVFISITELMNKEGGWAGWKKQGLTKKDNVHLAHAGYEKLGILIANDIKKQLKIK